MAFHSYAQVIRKLFNAYRSGPPGSVTCPSSCPCVDHSVSRLPPPTPRPIRTRFRSGCKPQALTLAGDGNSQVHYAKGTPSRHRGRSDRLKAHGFRVFFTPLSEVLFTFPSRYSSAIGLSVVFSLSGWSPIIQPGFLVSRPTQVPASQLPPRVRGSHPLRRGVPSASASPLLRLCRSYNPGTGLATAPVWALPIPLAATLGIVVTFSSCAYLDVSVQRVRLRLRRM